jgi:hypothetical protein
VSVTPTVSREPTTTTPHALAAVSGTPSVTQTAMPPGSP